MPTYIFKPIENGAFSSIKKLTNMWMELKAPFPVFTVKNMLFLYLVQLPGHFVAFVVRYCKKM